MSSRNRLKNMRALHVSADQSALPGAICTTIVVLNLGFWHVHVTMGRDFRGSSTASRGASLLLDCQAFR